MNDDWRNALSALRNNLPQGEKEEEKDIHMNSEASSKALAGSSQKTALTIVTDKKGRNGKIATIIEGFTIPQSKVEEIARKLKQQLGVGGSVREGEILIQGDHKAKVVKFLQNLEFKTRSI